MSTVYKCAGCNVQLVKIEGIERYQCPKCKVQYYDFDNLQCTYELPESYQYGKDNMIEPIVKPITQSNRTCIVCKVDLTPEKELGSFRCPKCKMQFFFTIVYDKVVQPVKELATTPIIKGIKPSTNNKYIVVYYDLEQNELEYKKFKDIANAKAFAHAYPYAGKSYIITITSKGKVTLDYNP